MELSSFKQLFFSCMPWYEGIACRIIGNRGHVIHDGGTYLDTRGLALITFLIQALVY